MAAALTALDTIRSQRGLAAALARALGLAPSTVSQWRKVPVAHVAAVEAFTGIDKSQLRPDVYAAEPNGRKAKRGKPKAGAKRGRPK